MNRSLPGFFFVSNGKRGDVWAVYDPRRELFLLSDGQEFTNIIGQAVDLQECYQVAGDWLSSRGEHQKKST